MEGIHIVLGYLHHNINGDGLFLLFFKYHVKFKFEQEIESR